MFYSKMKNVIVFFAQLCFFSVQGQPDADIPEQDILYNIFNMYSYNNLARPAPSNNFVVYVNHSLTLVAIVDMVDNMLIADTWQSLTWNDLRLQWNPREYRRMRQINIVDDQIWTPDILLYNNAAAGSGRTYKSIRCIVKNNGDVLWVPPTRVTAYCNDVNPSEDPSGTFIAGDKHCSLKFGSWTYNKDQLDMVIDREGLLLKDYNESPKFKIINTTVEKVDIEYSCCPSLYASVIYNITLRPKFSGPQRDEPATPVERVDEEPVDDDDVKPEQDKLEADDDDDGDDDDDDVGDDDGNDKDVADVQDNADDIDDNVDKADDDAILDDDDDADNADGGDVAGNEDAGGIGDDDDEIIADKVDDIGDLVQKAEKPEAAISPISEKQEEIDDDHKPLMD